MIDHVSAVIKKIVWLKPIFFIGAGASLIAFGYVVLFGEGADKDVYLIPSVVVVLWSLLCSLIFSVFPYVPPKPDRQQRLFERLKIRMARAGFHIGLLISCVLSAVAVWLTVRLLSVWWTDFLS